MASANINAAQHGLVSRMDDTQTTRTAGLGGAEPRAFKAGDVVGRFSIVSEIGNGGVGRIYEALDPNLKRRVALKLLHQRRSDIHRQRLIREAQSLARLGHPNVVTVHEVGSHQGALFIAMELVKGGTLKDWIARHPPGDAKRQAEAVRLLVEAGRGLIAAHGEGLIHRDVKPSNILIGEDGRARVADFGIVRATRGTEADADQRLGALEPTEDLVGTESETLTRSGVSVGTPAYMAPEQFADGEVGESADQFSFCVTAWEALCGKRPFSGRTVGELSANIRDGRFSSNNAALIPEALMSSLQKGLRPRAATRHRSLKALVDELETYASAEQPDLRSPRTRVVAGLVLGVAVTLGFAYRSLGGDAAEEGLQAQTASDEFPPPGPLLVSPAVANSSLRFAISPLLRAEILAFCTGGVCICETGSPLRHDCDDGFLRTCSVLGDDAFECVSACDDGTCCHGTCAAPEARAAAAAIAGEAELAQRWADRYGGSRLEASLQGRSDELYRKRVALRLKYDRDLTWEENERHDD